MAVHLDIEVEGATYRVALSRDDLGNYIADAAPGTAGDARAVLPVVRVIESDQEAAMRALLDSLTRHARGATASPLVDDELGAA